MSLNWIFQRGGGGGVQTKNPPCGEYGYFLEQHIRAFCSRLPKCQCENLMYSNLFSTKE